MPNKKAKERKRKKRLLNQRLSREGRTSVQYKKTLKRKKENEIQQRNY